MTHLRRLDLEHLHSVITCVNCPRMVLRLDSTSLLMPHILDVFLLAPGDPQADLHCLDLQHLHNVEMHVYCPQAVLRLDFQCGVDVSSQKYTLFGIGKSLLLVSMNTRDESHTTSIDWLPSLLCQVSAVPGLGYGICTSLCAC